MGGLITKWKDNFAVSKFWKHNIARSKGLMLGGYIDGASVNLKSNWRQIMLTETELFQLCQNLNISQQA